MLCVLETIFPEPRYLLKMIDDYFKSHIVLYQTEEGQRAVAVTAEVAQGSILGLNLWNTVYDCLL